MDKFSVTKGQLFIIVILLVYDNMEYTNPMRFGGKDAWISVIAMLVFGMGLFYVYNNIVKKSQVENAAELIKYCFGQKIAFIIFILTIIYFCFNFIVSVKRYVILVAFNSVETPGYIWYIVIGLVLIYMLSLQLEDIFKVIVLFVPIMKIVMIIMCLLLLRFFDIQNLLPVLDTTVSDFSFNLYNTICYSFSKAPYLFILLYHLKDNKDSLKVMYGGLVVGGVIYLALALTLILILGDTGLSKSVFFYRHLLAVMQTNLFEIFVNGKIYVVTLLELGLISKSAKHFLECYIGKSVKKRFMYIFVALLITISYLVKVNVNVIIYYMYLYNSALSIFYFIFVPALMWIIVNIRHHKKNTNNNI